MCRAPQGQLSATVAPVTALVNGQELPVQFSGLAPGYVGLYQVNVPIPGATPPGLGISLTLKEGGAVQQYRDRGAPMKKKIGLFGAKLLTRGRLAWFNRASLTSKGFNVVERPVSQGKEGIFLDTGRAIGYE